MLFEIITLNQQTSDVKTGVNMRQMRQKRKGLRDKRYKSNLIKRICLVDKIKCQFKYFC